MSRQYRQFQPNSGWQEPRFMLCLQHIERQQHQKEKRENDKSMGSHQTVLSNMGSGQNCNLRCVCPQWVHQGTVWSGELLSSFSSAPLHGVTHPMISLTTGWSTLCVRVIAGHLRVLGEWWGCASDIQSLAQYSGQPGSSQDAITLAKQWPRQHIQHPAWSLMSPLIATPIV